VHHYMRDGALESLKNKSGLQMSQVFFSIRDRRAIIATLVLFVLSCLGTTGLSESVSPLGLWENEDATFQIFKNNGKLSARIVALKVPKTPEGKEKTDIYNPDPAKRSAPVIGLVFMSGFVKKSDTRWDGGTIYDPRSGNTYSCFMELETPEKIKVRGFIGVSLLGRTEYWSRVK
jgi:uncharacterized protein (DUF2147 family)